jgi:hypothetical protein
VCEAAQTLYWTAALVFAVQDEKDEAAQSALLTKWGKMHGVRTALSISAFAVMLTAALRSRSST